MKLVQNRALALNSALSTDEIEIVGRKAADTVFPFMMARPDYKETPLVALPEMARELGVGTIDLKDEGQRFGLKSFKALGGSYAVARLVQEHAEAQLGRRIAPADLQSPEVRNVVADVTVCCATDGNHGRSVAAGAQLFGCRCVIFLHQGVSQNREQEIANFGAEIRRTKGNYDDSVAEATATSEREGWLLVSDFSWPGYERIPGLVMQGYSVMMAEITEQADGRYTHAFIQGGVGGLAASVAGYFKDWLGANRPKLVVVEPEDAACLQASAEKGELVKIPAAGSTIMAMLECYEPSLVAWRILEKSADAFLDIPDVSAGQTLRRLARPGGNDPALEIGESGVAGLAGLIAALGEPDIRIELELNESSRILVIGTEGATDPELYSKLLSEKLAVS